MFNPLRWLFSRHPSLKDTLALRPSDLGEIEVELRGGPPREVMGVCRDGSPLGEGTTAALRGRRVVRGWVVRVSETRDSEGPDYDIWLAWEEAGEVAWHRMRCGYDAVHWALGSPEHLRWFTETMQAGRALTLLLNDDGQAASPYGQYEVFLDDVGGRRWAAR